MYLQEEEEEAPSAASTAANSPQQQQHQPPAIQTDELLLPFTRRAESIDVVVDDDGDTLTDSQPLEQEDDVIGTQSSYCCGFICL